ncbi:50S ribosomal protein L6 [Chloroflexota bacterium]
MSRIGRVPIQVPSGVDVAISGGDVSVKGPKGELMRQFHSAVSINMEDNILLVSRCGNSKLHRSMHGLSRTLLANMVEGVSNGFEKDLEISGVGYRVQKSGDDIVLQVGYSHPVNFSPQSGISLIVEGTNRIKVQGIDKESVGATAAKIRAVRPPDRYKGKGIRYVGEKLRLKPGKGGRTATRK